MPTTTHALPQTTQLIQQGMDARQHIGAQVYISHAGQTIADLAIGDAAANVPMQADTLMNWLSSGKVVTTIAIARLIEAGRIDLDQPVAAYLPAFAAHGKDRITVRHVLTHTGGFRVAPFRFDRDSWDQIIDAICRVRPEPGWIPGEKAGYHAHTGWFILGELIQRVTAEDFSSHVRNHVLKPAGMNDSWVGMDHQRYLAYGSRIGVMMDTAGSAIKPRNYHLPDQIEPAKPSANACGPIRELGRLYEMLLAGGTIHGHRILEPDTVDRFTTRQRVGLYDHTFKRTIDWGLGFILDSKRYDQQHPIPYGYGPHASDRTFGHSGLQSSTGFADPEHELVVAIVFNGTPGEAKHSRRMWNTLAAVYQDLDLA